MNSNREVQPILQLAVCSLQFAFGRIPDCKMQNAKCKVQIAFALGLFIAHAVAGNAQEPTRPPPVSILITDDAHLVPPVISGSLSPYHSWPHQGMPAPLDHDARLSEIHPQQAEWINATFADLDYRSDAHCRAGWSECLRPRAVPSDTGRYCGYAVGGGAVRFGEGRSLDEGTWGWDYRGIVLRKRVALDWWHGRRYQGGAGQYHTDGPKLRHE